jgi:CheY-like chemotaxis protein
MSLDDNELSWLGIGNLNALPSAGRMCGGVIMRSSVLLCVDDSPQLLQVRKAHFEHLGFSVVTATSVPTALGVLEKIAIDAVLMDYKPEEGMDSVAVAFHIKHRFPQQAIILLSAFSEMPQRILWLVDEYVMRSEPPERIVQVIDKLTRSRARMASAEDVKHHCTAA